MAEIRCKNCHRVNADLRLPVYSQSAPTATGMLKMKCRKCREWIVIVLPFERTPAQTQRQDENKVAAAA